MRITPVNILTKNCGQIKLKNRCPWQMRPSHFPRRRRGNVYFREGVIVFENPFYIENVNRFTLNSYQRLVSDSARRRIISVTNLK
jgi:hypothetical protein